MALALACLLAYLLGGIPFGLLLARWMAGVDIRTIGSGNIGATNAARAFTGSRRAWAFGLIYLLDFAKGYVPTAFFPALLTLADPSAALAIGASAVLGHCFSPYLRGRGGKGVATGCGVFAAVEPIALVVALAVFVIVWRLTGKVFFGSLALGLALAVVIVLRDVSDAFTERAAVSVLAIVVAAFFFYTHRRNLAEFMVRGGGT